ncbi:S1 family peptidase [Wenjunlia vitaminophila]|uniref:S1 family peptidase n=1 Tax=Wenjunlia vitaminophila TaxID=76728 RepID=UPI0005938EF3|nr:S1 family peptidase [Wenjunlia vitaminophila]
MSASRPRRPRARPRAPFVALAAVGLITSTTSGVHGATAAPADELEVRRVATLESLLGPESTAGYYRDSVGRMVVNVTSSTAAEQVRASGATPRVVRRSGVELAAALSTLEKSARIPGTAWAADPQSNQVVVRADETVSDTELAQLNGVITTLGDAARLERHRGRFSPYLAGGEPIYAGNIRCSAGFNVHRGNRHFTLTAGHCTAGRGKWFTDPRGQEELGDTVGSSFPGNDYGLLERTTAWVPRPGDVSLHDGRSQKIDKVGTAFVGQSVQRSGSTTGVRGGHVISVGTTVNYPQGTVTGLVGTDACAEPGDSGGPFFHGSQALGLTSGGNGDCASGGITYFQPVDEALNAYDVSLN